MPNHCWLLAYLRAMRTHSININPYYNCSERRYLAATTILATPYSLLLTPPPPQAPWSTTWCPPQSAGPLHLTPPPISSTPIKATPFSSWEYCSCTYSRCHAYLVCSRRSNKNLIPGEVISGVISGTEQVLTMLRKSGIEITSTGEYTRITEKKCVRKRERMCVCRERVCVCVRE
jgi:hypothetical protein